jgi:hypothetical protein
MFGEAWAAAWPDGLRPNKALIRAIGVNIDEALATTTASEEAAELAAEISTQQAGIATDGATTAVDAAADAAALVAAATAGFTGFPDDAAYDFGFIADPLTYFDQDWGNV